MVPVVAWGALAGVLIAVALLIVNEATHPVVVKDPSALPRATGSTAFSLTALHKRLPPEALNTVQQYVDFFTTKQRRRVQDGLARSGRYLDAFRQIFRSEGIPEELVYLPMIESGYMETAVSPARAVGVWQFIEETGKRFNLEQNDWYDSRLDPIVSARAAAKLLKPLLDAKLIHRVGTRKGGKYLLGGGDAHGCGCEEHRVGDNEAEEVHGSHKGRSSGSVAT